DSNSIMVKENSTSQLEAFVVKPEHVTVVEDSGSIIDDNDESAFSIQQISFRTVGEYKMELENHVETIDRQDIMAAVKDSLPLGDCQKIFELYTQTGEIYNEFRAAMGYDGEPKQAHMAKYLGISKKIVK